MTRRTHVAIDIGASSGRHVLGWLEDGKLCLREMYRFENGADMRDGMLVWDHARLEREIVAGLKACRDAGETPETVAIDTWGVDYALLDESGALLGDTIAYRDKRTRATENTLDDAAELAPDRLFERFYRADAARTQKTGGYGIGLSAAKAIADAHRGSISACLENGAAEIVFTVVL